MRGSIYINNHNGEPEHVTLSPSASPTALMHGNNPYGFAWQKMLDILGLEHGYDGYGTDGSNLYHVLGSVAEAVRNRQKIESTIGVIAQLAATKSEYGYMDRPQIARLLGAISTQYLPNTGEDIEFKHFIGNITGPFAEFTNPDGVVLYYDMTREAHHAYISKIIQAEMILRIQTVQELDTLKLDKYPLLTADEVVFLIEKRREQLEQKRLQRLALAETLASKRDLLCPDKI